MNEPLMKEAFASLSKSTDQGENYILAMTRSSLRYNIIELYIGLLRVINVWVGDNIFFK